MKGIVLGFLACIVFAATSIAAGSQSIQVRKSFFELVGPAATRVEVGACCKVCTTGKACGDTCISRDKICHVGQGCACDG
jgi:hypothetical protein